MHAFMALFFYELVRDQIVFIWHAWATVVVHRWSLFLSAGPCLQHFFDDGKKMLLLTKWCQRQILIIYLCVYLFMYLFVFIYLLMYLFICAVWFKIWALFIATDLFASKCLLCITSHITTKYWQTLNLTTSKTDLTFSCHW